MLPKQNHSIIQLFYDDYAFMSNLNCLKYNNNKLESDISVLRAIMFCLQVC